MTIFCTQCGTQNKDDAAFCDNCGAKLRPAAQNLGVAAAAPEPMHEIQAKRAKSSRPIFILSALFLLLTIGGTVSYFLLAPPTASSGNLLAAAKVNVDSSAMMVKNRADLCIKNLDYSKPKLNIASYDNDSANLFKVLVTAGLYKAPVSIASGGFFSQTLLQYEATPEIEAWRDGKRLCFAKTVELVNVTHIEEPRQEVLDADNETKFHTVRAKLVWQTTGTAPWLENPQAQERLLDAAGGWKYKNGTLQKTAVVRFAAVDGQWYLEGTKQLRTLLAAADPSARKGAVIAGTDKGLFGDLLSTFSGLFSGNSHPLQGTWQTDVGGTIGTLGAFGGLGKLGALGPTTTFTKDSMESGGVSVKSKFEVDGNRVKVTPEGQTTAVVFEMLDRDTASLDLGLLELKFKRVP